MIWKAPGLWNTSRKKATPTVGNTFQTENYSINYQYLKTYHYENEQESTEEQRAEIRERKCSKSNRFGNHPEADNVTHTAGRAHGYRSDGLPRNGSRSQRYGRNTAAGHVQDTACNGHSRNRP